MTIDIARAWKDEKYRKTLTAEELASLPPNPAGSEELSEKELEEVSGGIGSASSLCCVTGSSSCCKKAD